MAIKIVREQRKNADGTYDIIHPETQAKVVWMSDGRSVEEATENKQDKLIGSVGQVVGFDANGNAVTQEMPNEIVVSDTAPTDEDVEVWINTGDDDGLDFVSGSSNAPDLVIGLNVANTRMYGDNNGYPAIDQFTVDDVSIESGNINTVKEKVLKGLPVTIAMREIHFYGDTLFARGIGFASHVTVTSNGGTYENPNYNNLDIAFMLTRVPESSITYGGFPVPICVLIGIDLTTGIPNYYGVSNMSR